MTTTGSATTARPATAAVHAAHAEALASLPFADRDDFANAERGFLGSYEPRVVMAADGHQVWDVDAFNFLDADAPDTVHPGLWRHSQLTRRHGLFEIVEGLYQVRGLDVSNITFVEGSLGVVVIDPLVGAENAAAALALYRQHRGPRPVTAVLYTHSHVDHFGGVGGILSPDEVAEGRIPVIAPAGMSKETVSENVYAGGAMNRRSELMFGARLRPGPRGHVGSGIGPAGSGWGTVTFIQPTREIETDLSLRLDGVEFEIQLTPDSEAPAELQFFLPRFGALCVPENATHSQHNLLTPRGALVRDAHAWARYLDDAIRRFGERTSVVFASHHWPTWGRGQAVAFLAEQRDLYAYLHDQTLRMINAGLTAPEIAETIELPPELESRWHLRGTYGTVTHNVKAIYQRYLGWYDGNPVNLWKHPPQQAARRYLDYMGGADAVVARAAGAYAEGDFRWVAEVVGHVVFAEPDHAAARELLADTLEQLGYLAESAPWRCSYLTAALELREGIPEPTSSLDSPQLLAQLTPEQWFDTLATRLNGPRAFGERLSVRFVFADLSADYRLALDRGVLWHRRDSAEAADLSLEMPFGQLPAFLLSGRGSGGLADFGIRADGDPDVLDRLLALLDEPDRRFAIVTP